MGVSLDLSLAGVHVGDKVKLAHKLTCPSLKLVVNEIVNC